MGTGSGRSEGEPGNQNEYFTELPLTFDEWLQRKKDVEIASARAELIKDHGIDSQLQRIVDVERER